jgi:hypothetical protein
VYLKTEEEREKEKEKKRTKNEKKEKSCQFCQLFVIVVSEINKKFNN